MAHTIVYFSFFCICLFPAASAQLKPGNDYPTCADVGYNFPHDYAKLCPGGRVLVIECQIADGSRAKFKLGEAGLSDCRDGEMLLYTCESSGICFPPGYTGETPTIPGAPFYTAPTPTMFPPMYTGPGPTYTPFLAMLTHSSERARPTTPRAPRGDETSTPIYPIVG